MDSWGSIPSLSSIYRFSAACGFISVCSALGLLRVGAFHLPYTDLVAGGEKECGEFCVDEMLEHTCRQR